MEHIIHFVSVFSERGKNDSITSPQNDLFPFLFVFTRFSLLHLQGMTISVNMEQEAYFSLYIKVFFLLRTVKKRTKNQKNTKNTRFLFFLHTSLCTIFKE